MKKVKLVPTIEFRGSKYVPDVPLTRLKQAFRTAISVLQTIDQSKDLELEANPVLRINCLYSEGELLCVEIDDLDELREILTELETLPDDQ